MSRIQAEVFRSDAGFMPAKFVYSKKETDAVVTTCTGLLHEKRKLDFMVVVATADHIKSPSEVPGFIITVPPPGSIGVRIMARTVVMIRAARRVHARNLSFAIGVRVNCNDEENKPANSIILFLNYSE